MDYSSLFPRALDISAPRLSRRDACTDAIPGTVTEFCTPGYTLCCVPDTAGRPFPTCRKVVGLGACCTSDEGCYVDTTSDCGAPGAVRCTKFSSKVAEACCPALTTCPTDYEQTEYVRCNIAIGVKSVITSSSTSTTTSTTTSSSSTPTTSSSIETTTGTVTQATLNPSTVTVTGTAAQVTPTSTLTPTPAPSTTPGLSTGAKAGIGIGAAAGIFALLALLFLIYKRGKRREQEEKLALETEQNLNSGQSAALQGAYHDNVLQHGAGAEQFKAWNSGQQEVPGERPVVGELPGGQAVPHELPGRRL